MTYRHNLISSAIYSFLTAVGCVCSYEPRFYNYTDGSKRRPDITVHLFPTQIVTDVTVVNDIDAAAIAKIDKHGSASAARGHLFVPFVMSKWGEFHPSCINFVEKCLQHLDTSTRRIMKLKLMKKVTDAFVEGSSAMVRNFFAHPPSALFAL